MLQAYSDGSATPEHINSGASPRGSRARSPEDWEPDSNPSTLSALIGRPDAPSMASSTGTSTGIIASAGEPGEHHCDDLPATPMMGVASVRLAGRHLPLETIYTIELPPMPDEFAVDVELSNGLTVVVPHPRHHVDGRWVTVAKDATNRRQLVARFQRHTPLPAHQHVLRIVGSPFAGDVSALLVLLFATLTVLSASEPAAAAAAAATDADNGTSAALLFGRVVIARRPRRSLTDPSMPPTFVDALTGLLAAVSGVPTASVAVVDLLSAALLSSLLVALCARLLGRLAERFPPLSSYTLCLQPRAGLAVSDDDDADEHKRRRGWLSRGRRGVAAGKPSFLDEEGGSPLQTLHTAFAACIVDAPPPGGAHRATGEIDLAVGPLLAAIEKILQYSEAFGPLMILAVKNDEGNIRKARKAWEKYSAKDTQAVNTLRGLLESEKATGIHRPGAVLHDPSAAIALLWMRRTLQFLGRCFQGVVDDLPMSEVGTRAYRLELEPFHNWLIKQTFAMALNGMPRRQDVVVRLGGHLPEGERERLLSREMEVCNQTIQKVIDAMRSLFEELGLEDMRKV